ncbi:serine hydrolase domain-containing protein [Streptomyces alkaliterrae]|uniref:Beta-lactamase family protein n=1 Tax=Streptomyces alkaliterrae TaxID=2213162 RepID=A0A5P0YPM0_9ACTN|nr:serine hydrolase domain-containing protein [Streptomyces alkaliterrae]MBB1258403.1 beta-lactamase family protein [Streptomyces alkaliterrae]MQS02231.1 serine hydrolase [Streptomyces alkaliterrae]
MPLPRPSRLRLSAATLVAGACLIGLISAPAHAGVPATEPEPDPEPGHGHRHGHGHPDGPDRALKRQLRDLVAAPGGPPGVIAVLKRDGRPEVYRAGVAEAGTDRPIEPTDHTRTASTSKAFSGAVALHLVDRGALDPDSTIGEVLPDQPRAWHRVTLRQLLNHTSGLPDFSADPRFVELLLEDPRRRFDSRRLLDFVADKPLEFRPGTRYRYSNSDNIAVALMAEAVTGQRYEKLLAKLVYRPLGLRRTSLPQGYELPEPYMHGYAVSADGPPEDVSEAVGASGAWASGGIVSTPKDMTAFVRGYVGGELFSRATQREQRRWIEGASEPAGPGRNEAGLAVFRYTTRCGVVHGHTGNFPGYTQLMAATPDGGRSLTFSVTSQINEAADPELLERLRRVQEDFVCALLSR